MAPGHVTRPSEMAAADGPKHGSRRTASALPESRAAPVARSRSNEAFEHGIECTEQSSAYAVITEGPPTPQRLPGPT